MASYFKAQEINKVEKQQLPESTVAVYSNITPKNKEEAKKLEDEILFAIKREHQLDMNRLIRGKELPKKLQKYFPSDFGGSGVDCDIYFPLDNSDGKILTNDEIKSRLLTQFSQKKDTIKNTLLANALAYLSGTFKSKEEIENFISSVEQNPQKLEEFLQNFIENSDNAVYTDFLLRLYSKAQQIEKDYNKTFGKKYDIPNRKFNELYQKELEDIFGTSAITKDAIDDINEFVNLFKDSTYSINQILYQMRTNPQNFDEKALKLASSINSIKKGGVKESFFDLPISFALDSLERLKRYEVFKKEKAFAEEHALKMLDKIINKADLELNESILAFVPEIEKSKHIDRQGLKKIKKRILSAIEEYVKENDLDINPEDMFSAIRTELFKAKDILKKEFTSPNPELEANPFAWSFISSRETAAQNILKEAISLALLKQIDSKNKTYMYHQIFDEDTIKDIFKSIIDLKKEKLVEEDIIDFMNVYNAFSLAEKRDISQKELKNLLDLKIFEKNRLLLNPQDKKAFKDIVKHINEQNEQFNLSERYPNFTKTEVRQRVLMNNFLAEDANLKEQIAKKAGLYKLFGMSKALSEYKICSEKAQNPTNSLETPASMMRDCFERLSDNLLKEAEEYENQVFQVNSLGALNPFVAMMIISSVVKRQFSEDMRKQIYEVFIKSNDLASFVYEGKDTKDRIARESVVNADILGVDYTLIEKGSEDKFVEELQLKKILHDVKGAIDRQQTSLNAKVYMKFEDIANETLKKEAVDMFIKQTEEKVENIKYEMQELARIYNLLNSANYATTAQEKRKLLNEAKERYRNLENKELNTQDNDIIREIVKKYKELEKELKAIESGKKVLGIMDIASKDLDKMDYKEALALFKVNKAILKEVNQKMLDNLKRGLDNTLLERDKKQLIENLQALKLKIFTDEEFLKDSLIKEVREYDPLLAKNLDSSKSLVEIFNEANYKIQDNFMKEKLRKYIDAVKYSEVKGKNYKYLNNFLIANEEILKNNEEIFEQIKNDGDFFIRVQNSSNNMKSITFAKGLNAEILKNVTKAEEDMNLNELSEYVSLIKDKGITNIPKSFVDSIAQIYDNAKVKYEILKETQVEQYRYKNENTNSFTRGM